MAPQLRFGLCFFMGLMGWIARLPAASPLVEGSGLGSTKPPTGQVSALGWLGVDDPLSSVEAAGSLGLRLRASLRQPTIDCWLDGQAALLFDTAPPAPLAVAASPAIPTFGLRSADIELGNAVLSPELVFLNRGVEALPALFSETGADRSTASPSLRSLPESGDGLLGLAVGLGKGPRLDGFAYTERFYSRRLAASGLRLRLAGDPSSNAVVGSFLRLTVQTAAQIADTGTSFADDPWFSTQADRFRPPRWQPAVFFSSWQPQGSFRAGGAISVDPSFGQGFAAANPFGRGPIDGAVIVAIGRIALDGDLSEGLTLGGAASAGKAAFYDARSDHRDLRLRADFRGGLLPGFYLQTGGDWRLIQNDLAAGDLGLSGNHSLSLVYRWAGAEFSLFTGLTPSWSGTVLATGDWAGRWNPLGGNIGWRFKGKTAGLTLELGGRRSVPLTTDPTWSAWANALIVAGPIGLEAAASLTIAESAPARLSAWQSQFTLGLQVLGALSFEATASFSGPAVQKVGGRCWFMVKSW